MIDIKWHGQFEAVTVAGVGSLVRRKSNFSHYWDTVCICFDSEFGNPREAAEMIATLLNAWMEKIQKINTTMENRRKAEIMIDTWLSLFLDQALLMVASAD